MAVYVDGTWDVTDRFHLTGGFRYTDEEKSWAGRPRVNVFLLDGGPTLEQLGEPINGADFNKYPSGVVRNSKSWQEPTYRLIAGYDFSDDLFGFFGYSRGFKSGGYNDQLGTQLNPITLISRRSPPILKSRTRLKAVSSIPLPTAQQTSRSTLTTWNTRTPNVRLTSHSPGARRPCSLMRPEMTVKGLEAEGSWAATDALTFNYNVSWMDAEFDSFQADTNYDGEIDVDLSGQPVTRAPELMGSVDGTYVHTIGNGHRLEWKLRASYEDESVAAYSDVDAAYNTSLNEKTLVDASRLFFRVLTRTTALWTSSLYKRPLRLACHTGNALLDSTERRMKTIERAHSRWLRSGSCQPTVRPDTSGSSLVPSLISESR